MSVVTRAICVYAAPMILSLSVCVLLCLSLSGSKENLRIIKNSSINRRRARSGRHILICVCVCVCLCVCKTLNSSLCLQKIYCLLMYYLSFKHSLHLSLARPHTVLSLLCVISLWGRRQGQISQERELLEIIPDPSESTSVRSTGASCALIGGERAGGHTHTKKMLLWKTVNLVNRKFLCTIRWITVIDLTVHSKLPLFLPFWKRKLCNLQWKPTTPCMTPHVWCTVSS